MSNAITETNCSSIDEFWQVLSPVGGRFDQPAGHTFIFRGQRNSAWALVPRAFRSDVIERYKRGMLRIRTDHPGQWLFEYMLLHSFLFHCDSVGLSVPGDSMAFREYFTLNNISNIHAINNSDWPQDRVVPLMALAQHHGVPTRLLDWSDNPLIACYHAAESALREDDDLTGTLAVFALEKSRIHRQMLIKHVHVPGHTSPNLAVQRGSFILVTNAGGRGELFTPDVSLESQLPDGSRPILHKITLPGSFAPDLLLRCAKFGVSGASLFPGYDGIGRAVLESVRAYNYQAESKA